MTKPKDPTPRPDKSEQTCPACGVPLMEGALFCATCGAKVKEKDAPAATVDALIETIREETSPGMAKKRRQVRGSRIPIAWVAAVFGGLALILLVISVVFLAFSEGDGGFLGGGQSGLGDPVPVVEKREQKVSSGGGEASLGTINIAVPQGLVEGESELSIAQVDPNDLPVESPEGLIGEVYALDWEPGTSIDEGPVKVNFKYDPEDLPAGVSEDYLAILKFDGTDWLRLPSAVDTSTHTVTAEVTYFSLFSLSDLEQFLQSELESGLSWLLEPDRLAENVQFTGRVSYTVVEFANDTNPKIVPASNMRYALIDSNAGILHSGWLDSDGGFTFTLPKGKDVGFDLEIVVRIYSVMKGVGTVVTHTGPARAKYAYDSPSLYYDLPFDAPGDFIGFGSIVIPEEKSGPFNILHAVKQGYEYVQENGAGYEPDPVEVVWCCSGNKDYGTSYDPDNGYMYLTQNPQTAYDDDLVLSLYGQHVLFWMYQGQPHDCPLESGKPNKRTTECNAWVQGWGYFFSSLVRSTPMYEIYEDKFQQVQESHDLENEILGTTARFPGAVANVLWDMVDSPSDGEKIEVPVVNLFLLLTDYGFQIDSLTAFYDFWRLEYGDDQPTCLLFADWDIVEPVDCGPIGPPSVEEQPQPAEEESVVLGDLSYDDVVEGYLEAGEQEVWRFEGEQGEVVTIEMWGEYVDEDLDPYVTLLQESDNRVVAQNDNFAQGSLDAVIYSLTLPKDGKYLIVAEAGSGSGKYLLTIYPMEAPPSDELPPSTETEPSDEMILGVIKASGAPKTWTVEIPSDFTRVEIASYGAGKEEETNAYGGWKAWLKVNGEFAYDWVKYVEGKDAVYHDYILGEEVYGRSGVGAYIDVTSLIHSGENEITFYHYTSGDGIGIKLRITRD
jgi:hypothetical protein